MTNKELNEEFVRNHHCNHCEVDRYCRSRNEFCHTAKNMLKLGELLDGQELTKMDAIFEKFMHDEYCVECIVVCFGISERCTTANDMRKILKWKKQKKRMHKNKNMEYGKLLVITKR